ncbi:MAG: SCO family protein, partial [Deltaproteobacteria bacterium]|nr:SCO family protein [Deltaproteobacteria bacterium]
YLEEYGRDAREGWHFLVGQEKNIQQLAGEVGFRYKYDEEIKQYAHAAGLFLLTPEGKLARVLFGIQFDPKDMRLGLVEASEGKIGSVIDRILLYCYRFDPKASKYVLFASNLMKGAAAATVFGLGLFILLLSRKTPKKKKRA